MKKIGPAKDLHGHRVGRSAYEEAKKRGWPSPPKPTEMEETYTVILVNGLVELMRTLIKDSKEETDWDHLWLVEEEIEKHGAGNPNKWDYGVMTWFYSFRLGVDDLMADMLGPPDVNNGNTDGKVH